MRTLMLAKQKGGVGASVVAREVGVAAAAAGKRVVFVDLDPQGTLRGWWNRRTEVAAGEPRPTGPHPTGPHPTGPNSREPNPGLAVIAPDRLAAGLNELHRAGVDLCIVDTPPSVHPFLRAVMRLADYILLPTRPTTDDLDALPGVLDLVDEVGRPFAFVVTQVPAGRSRLYDDAMPVLAQRGKVAPPLRIRADFPVAAATGRTATEIAAKGKAAEEVAALWQFVALELARLGRREAGVPAASHAGVPAS